VAEAKGVDVQKVVDALVADATRRIDQALADDDITAEHAASLKEGLADRINRLVNDGGPRRGEHRFGERNGTFPRGGELAPGGVID
jgi:hypothetical protein